MGYILIGHILMVAGFLACDWRARTIFVALAYPRKYGHGKSWNRAHKHYKTHWTFWQRILWIPVFKEKYEDKYRSLAYLTYIHIVVTIGTIIAMLVAQFVFDDLYLERMRYVTYPDCCLVLIRVVHNEATARGTLF